MIHTFCLRALRVSVLALALGLPSAFASEPQKQEEQPNEQKAPAPLPSQVSQKDATSLAAERAKAMAEQARKVGIRSIIKGRNNMRAGRLARSPALVLVGAMQITEGIKSLQAAKEAEKMALENAAAEEAMGEVKAGPTSASLLSQKSGGAGARSLSGQSAGGELLSDETVDAIGEIEEEYGFDGPQFLAAVQKGASPVDIFQKAENGPGPEEARSAYAQAKEELGQAQVSTAQAPSALPVSGADAPEAEAGASSADADRSGEELRERLRRRLAERLKKKARVQEGEEEELLLSPEVQAALEEKRARSARRISSYEERTIFEQVHLRYQARQKAYYSTPLVGVHGQ